MAIRERVDDFSRDFFYHRGTETQRVRRDDDLTTKTQRREEEIDQQMMFG